MAYENSKVPYRSTPDYTPHPNNEIKYYILILPYDLVAAAHDVPILRAQLTDPMLEKDEAARRHEVLVRCLAGGDRKEVSVRMS